MDEIEKRERLECDPSRVFIGEEEESDSEGEDEQLVENFGINLKNYVCENQSMRARNHF